MMSNIIECSVVIIDHYYDTIIIIIIIIKQQLMQLCERDLVISLY